MRFAVLVSGSGTNLQALLDAERSGDLAPAEIALVVANKPGVRALERAQIAGKPAVVVDHKRFSTREAFEDAVAEELDRHRVEAVVLAGFMRVLTPRFLDRYPDRILNIHPALLPSFPGVDAQSQAWEYGVKVSGCTVHFVDATVDGGAVILQAAVPVLDDDDTEALRARILVEEHKLLPRAVKLLAAGKIERRGRRVRILS